MKLKKQNNSYFYSIEIADRATPGSAGQSHCYLAYLDKTDDNLEFRRTFCKKTSKANKKTKKTTYCFEIEQPDGFYELGQQLNEFQFRKVYFELKKGEFGTTERKTAVDFILKKMKHEADEKEKADKIAKEKKRLRFQKKPVAVVVEA